MKLEPLPHLRFRTRLIDRESQLEFNEYYDIKKEPSSGITTGHEGEE